MICTLLLLLISASSQFIYSFALNAKQGDVNKTSGLKQPHIRSALHDPGGGNEEGKRDVNIGIRLREPTVSFGDEMRSQLMEEELEEVTEKIKATPPPVIKKPRRKLKLKPGNECDGWDVNSQTCWLDGCLGCTTTFRLITISNDEYPDVVWQKEFAVKDSKKRALMAIDPNTDTDNLVFGQNGYELRVSPITELDIEDNQFSAILSGEINNSSRITFKIRIFPKDMGYVYVGETIQLSIKSFASLPFTSMTFSWYQEKDKSLPSNMVTSATGTVLTIYELRLDQEGVIACSAYTNRGIHALKRRFLIKDLNKNFDVLLNEADSNLEVGGHYGNSRRFLTRQKRDEPFIGNLETSSPGIPESEPVNFGGQQMLGLHIGEDEAALPDSPWILPHNKLDDLPPVPNACVRSTSSNGEAVVDVECMLGDMRLDDVTSQFISYCAEETDCSIFATCIKNGPSEQGFCRCTSGYKGPGIFCREEF